MMPTLTFEDGTAAPWTLATEIDRTLALAARTKPRRLTDMTAAPRIVQKKLYLNLKYGQFN